MRVGVLDIGSNTARLLVADIDRERTLRTVDERRAHLRLGAEIERRGTIGPRKLAEAAAAAGGFARHARALGAERLAVVLTAPGRQAPGHALADALGVATGVRVRVLTAEEEGRLAYEGALAAVASPPEVTAVADVGGGSTEIAVGTPLLGPAWVRSVDLGCLRLTCRWLAGDPPGRRAVAAARAAVRDALSDLRPPVPDLALAVGGSARAIARVTGGALDEPALARVTELLARQPAARSLRPLGIDGPRAETVLAGALLLGETARLLGRPLELARGGLREGVALALAPEAATAAA